jgi:hypothetical protein
MRIPTLLLTATLCCYAQTFRIAGVILNSETGAPVPKAHMTLAAAGKTMTVVTGGRRALHV